MGIYGHIAHRMMETQNLNEGFFSDLKKKREEKKAEKERAKKEAEDKTVLEYLNKTLKYAKSPYTLGDGYDSEILTIIHHLGVSSETLGKFLSSNKGSLKKDVVKYYFDKEMTASQKKIADNSLAVLENDDYCAFVNLSDKKIYEVYSDGGKSKVESFKFSKELNIADWSDYKEISDKNGDILGQIKKIISK